MIIVEDNVLVAKFFRMALERAGGYSCTVTEDVPEMLKEIEAGEVDLVLTGCFVHQRGVEGPIGQRRRTLPNLEQEVAPTTCRFCWRLLIP